MFACAKKLLFEENLRKKSQICAQVLTKMQFFD
jgi:hypothetical protein